MTADKTVMTANAPSAPVKMIMRSNLIARIAAMKKVLSPSSVTQIIITEFVNACHTKIIREGTYLTYLFV